MASKGSASERDGFESLYKRLEDTVAKMEQGNLTLEESIALYEDGMKLAQACQEQLQKAEQRITRLQEAFSGSAGGVREDIPDCEPEPAPDEAAIE